MKLDLRKSDIHRFGHTMFQEDGHLSIVFDADDGGYGVSIILLRNVLRLFGDYSITETLDWWSEMVSEEDFPDEIVVRTNLPWSVFMATKQE